MNKEAWGVINYNNKGIIQKLIMSEILEEILYEMISDNNEQYIDSFLVDINLMIINEIQKK